MLLRSFCRLRGSGDGRSFASTLKQWSPALSTLGSLSSRSWVDRLHIDDGSKQHHTAGFLPFVGAGLAFSVAAPVFYCTGTDNGSDEDRAAAPQPDPSKHKTKVQHNIMDFFQKATPETKAAAAAADAVRQSKLPKTAPRGAPPPVKPGRPRLQPTPEVPTQLAQSQPRVILPKEVRTNWWHPYLIKEILLAVKLNLGWRGTVSHLQNKFRSGIYDNLDESTLRGWYTKGSVTELTASSLELLRKVCGHTAG